jgi:hypothetical protein
VPPSSSPSTHVIAPQDPEYIQIFVSSRLGSDILLVVAVTKAPFPTNECQTFSTELLSVPQLPRFVTSPPVVVPSYKDYLKIA